MSIGQAFFLGVAVFVILPVIGAIISTVYRVGMKAIIKAISEYVL